MRGYLTLGAAVLCEVFGDTMMKFSNGFTRKAPIIGIVIGYVAAFALEAQALKVLPLGFVYAAWTSLGVVLTAAVGAIIWRERITWKKALGIVAIIAGVVLMKAGV